MRLLTLHPGQWKSPDDFYRLAAKCEGDTLYYRPPFGDRWVELATFEDGRFVDLGSGRKWIFHRIDASDAAAWNRAILAEREPHDYRIQPDGSVRRSDRADAREPSPPKRAAAGRGVPTSWA